VSLAGVKVGDEVVVTDVIRREPWRSRVEAVGRKYATIDGEKYEIATGRKADANRQAWAWTVAAWETNQLRAALLRAVLSLRDVRISTTLSDDDVREATAMLEQVAKKLGGAS
jgi:hypothetical protein